MKSVIIGIFLLCRVGAIDLTALELDFDGGRNVREEATILSESQPLHMPTNAVREEKPFPDVKAFLLSESGELVELKPTVTKFDEDGFLRRTYEMSPGEIAGWYYHCGGSGDPQQWFFKGSYSQSQDEYSGHFNHADHPPLSFSQFHTSLNPPPESEYAPLESPYLSPTLTSETTYYRWQKIPAYAGHIEDREDFFGACSGTIIYQIEVKVKGLKKMPSGSAYNYILYGTPSPSSYHREKFWGTQNLIDALIDVSAEYKKACPTAAKLQITSMSLPWGGLFDIHGNWAPPHRTHRSGENADIRKWVVKKSNRAKLIEIMCSKVKDKQVYSEGDADGEENHYHLGPTTNLKNFYDVVSETYDERIMPCCTTPVPAACIDLQNNGGDIIYEPDQPSDCQ